MIEKFRMDVPTGYLKVRMRPELYFEIKVTVRATSGPLGALSRESDPLFLRNARTDLDVQAAVR